MFVKVTYAQTIDLNEVIVTGYYPEEEEEEELDDCHPDSDYYDECYCDPESCYGKDDEYYYTYYQEEEELDDCHPDSDNYVECDCYPENCEDTQTQEQENCNKTCPDSQTLNTVSCTCVNKPNKNWYQDLDNDGYHSATKSYYKSPGTGWKTTTLGVDCDDNNANKTTNCCDYANERNTYGFSDNEFIDHATGNEKSNVREGLTSAATYLGIGTAPFTVVSAIEAVMVEVGFTSMTKFASTTRALGGVTVVVGGIDVVVSAAEAINNEDPWKDSDTLNALSVALGAAALIPGPHSLIFGGLSILVGLTSLAVQEAEERENLNGGTPGNSIPCE